MQISIEAFVVPFLFMSTDRPLQYMEDETTEAIEGCTVACWPKVQPNLWSFLCVTDGLSRLQLKHLVPAKACQVSSVNWTPTLTDRISAELKRISRSAFPVKN